MNLSKKLKLKTDFIERLIFYNYKTWKLVRFLEWEKFCNVTVIAFSSVAYFKGSSDKEIMNIATCWNTNAAVKGKKTALRCLQNNASKCM
jgi:hypothetical protein